MLGVVFRSAVPTFQQMQIFEVYVVEKQKNKVLQEYPNMVLIYFFVPTKKNCSKFFLVMVGVVFRSAVPTFQQKQVFEVYMVEKQKNKV